MGNILGCLIYLCILQAPSTTSWHYTNICKCTNECVFRKDQEYTRTAMTANESKVQTVKEPWIPSYIFCIPEPRDTMRFYPAFYKALSVTPITTRLTAHRSWHHKFSEVRTTWEQVIPVHHHPQAQMTKETCLKCFTVIYTLNLRLRKAKIIIS